MPFSDPLLDRALTELILNQKAKFSIKSKIKYCIDKYIDWNQGLVPLIQEDLLLKVLKALHYQNSIGYKILYNGLGLAVHNIYAMKVEVVSIIVQ